MAQTIPGNEAWRNVPNLNWNSGNRKVKLNANWDDNRNYNWACPVVLCRDCSSSKRRVRYPSFCLTQVT